MSKHAEILGKEHVPSLLLRLALPSLVGLLVSNLYVLVDRFFVGRYVGSFGLAAMTAMMPISMIIFAVAILIGRGTQVLYSISLGEKNYVESQRLFGMSMVLYAMAALFITVFGLIYVGDLLTIFGSSPAAAEYGKEYLSITLFGTIFVMLGFHNNLIRAEGFSGLAMMTQILGAVTNVGLDYLFVVVCKWGMSGAASATVISQGCSAIWVMSFFVRKRSVAKLDFRTFRLYGLEKVGKVFYNGCSPFFINIMGSIIWTVQNHMLVRHGGEIALAAFGVILSVGQMLNAPLFGITMGMQPIIGYNTGARKYDRVLEAFFSAIKFASVAALVPYILILTFPEYIIGFFVEKEGAAELIKLGSYSMRWYLLLFPLGCGNILVSQYFQAIGHAPVALFLALCRQLLFQMPLIFILPHFFGYNGVLFSGPLGDCLAFLVAFSMMYGEIKKLRLKFAEEDNLKLINVVKTD